MLKSIINRFNNTFKPSWPSASASIPDASNPRYHTDSDSSRLSDDSHAPEFTFRFLSLPPELGHEVLGHIVRIPDSIAHETIGSLSLTCRAFRELAAPYLFQSIYLTNTLSTLENSGPENRVNLPGRYLVRTQSVNVVIDEFAWVDDFVGDQEANLVLWRFRHIHSCLHDMLGIMPNLSQLHFHFRLQHPSLTSSNKEEGSTSSLLSLLSLSRLALNRLHVGFWVEYEDFGFRNQRRISSCLLQMEEECRANITGVTVDTFSLREECFTALLSLDYLDTLRLGTNYILVSITTLSAITRLPPIQRLVLYSKDEDDGRISWGRLRGLIALCSATVSSIRITHSIQFSPLERHRKSASFSIPHLREVYIRNGAMDDDPTDSEDPSHWRRLHCLLSSFCDTPVQTFCLDEVYFRLKGFANQAAASRAVAAWIREDSELISFDPPKTSPFEILAACLAFLLSKQREQGKWKGLKNVQLGRDLEASLRNTGKGRTYVRRLEEFGARVRRWEEDDMDF
ncbi:hypothetical protein BT69DRAFT_353351 [Atractiella rhizophila]|nr:hypothetical protein BT69DRAFT_353351 [Atractiella rhizophila]